MRRRRLIHVLAFVMQLCMAWMSVSVLVHSEDDDVLCNPVLVVHDHSAHHIGAAPVSPSAPDHCFICHTQSLRSLGASIWVSSLTTAGQAVADVVGLSVGTTPLARRPARAPPLA
ncbi:MAG: hypothetical protein JSU08_08100 [Acidobacteria bacterium]|nr:hypothetical protein [Acidobacteriota bacterium]